MNLQSAALMEFSFHASDVAVLIAAGKFAAQPETLPVFSAWLKTDLPVEMMPAPDQIPEILARVSAALATPIVAELERSRTRK